MSVPFSHSLLRRPAPAPYFHPFFLIFQIPPLGEVIKIYRTPPPPHPPLKKWGGSELYSKIKAKMKAMY